MFAAAISAAGITIASTAVVVVARVMADSIVDNIIAASCCCYFFVFSLKEELEVVVLDSGELGLTVVRLIIMRFGCYSVGDCYSWCYCSLDFSGEYSMYFVILQGYS